MARPRVFVSSTYYDLKHLRSSIENFIEGMGYEPVLSEKDNIAFAPDVPLDESCFREARNSDVYVLIIGGRYGSEISAHKGDGLKVHEFFDRYESITKHEYLNALERNIPIYILIDAAVEAEFQTYLQNKENKTIKYAHVDSVNVFGLFEEVRQKKQNNPIKLFSRYSEIECWLREQWAGLFREFIHRLTTTQQIQDLSTKIEELGQTTETLKRYLEEIVENVSNKKGAASELIKQENARLVDAKRDAELLSYGYVKHLTHSHGITADQIRDALINSVRYSEFIDALFKDHAPMCIASSRAFGEINEARLLLDAPAYAQSDLDAVKGSLGEWRMRKGRASTLKEEVAPKGRKAPRKKVAKRKPASK